MNHIRATRPLWRMNTIAQRAGQVSRRQRYATEPAIPPQPTPPHTPASPPNPNTPPSKPPSRVGAYYKSFSYPVLKTFLIALFTYQLAYYAWLKLEVIEEKHDKSTEVADLQEQLRDALVRQKAKVGDMMEETREAGRAVVEGVKEGGEEVVKATGAVGKVANGGWWPW